MSTKSITFQTNDTIVTSGDVIGKINFAASNEADGGVAINLVGEIRSMSEGVFTSSLNPASIVIATSEADSASTTDRIKVSDLGHIIPFGSGSQDLGDINLPYKVGYFASGVHLKDIVPADTTDLLYNQGGIVYFDGLAVGSGYAGGVISGGSGIITDASSGIHVDPTTSHTWTGTHTFDAQDTLMNSGSMGFMRLFDVGEGGYSLFDIAPTSTFRFRTFEGDPATLSCQGLTSPTNPITISPNTNLRVQSSVLIQEQNSADVDVASYGQVWVSGSVPNVMMFTDDAGNDFTVAMSGTGGGGGGISVGTSGLIAQDSTFIIDPAGSGEISELTIGRALKSSIYETENPGATRVDLNFNLTNMQHFIISGDATVWFSGVDVGQRLFVRIEQDNTGNHTITWPTNIRWPGNFAPTLSDGANELDVFGFTCTASGAVWEERDFDGYVIGYNLASG